MPSFRIETKVNASMPFVWSKFDEALLKNLSPPFPKVKILQFEGCETGNKVALQIDLIIIKPLWSTIITDHQKSESEIFFIDEGIKVPFGIKFWKHTHKIISNGPQNCTIQDFVAFKSIHFILDLFLFPFLWGMIFYRKPFYRKYLHQI